MVLAGHSAKRIMVFGDYYLPGYRGGGVITALSNIIDRFRDEFDFWLVTRDRDCGEVVPYKEIQTDIWQEVNGVHILYTSPGKLSLGYIRRLIAEVQPDVVYLNSFFSWNFTIRPLIIIATSCHKKIPVILAPRGELAKGALVVKHFKKILYLALARSIGLYKQVLWHASSEYEKEDIASAMGNHVAVIIAPDVVPRIIEGSYPTKERLKAPGSLKCIYLSRISPNKNLAGALEILKGVIGKVEFNIFGPVEDQKYWADCQAIINDMPPEIKISYNGVIPPEQVKVVLAEHHLLLFPTWGENFGHAIIESLAAGCPVLISDQTPWRGLKDKGVGWDLPLKSMELYTKALQQCLDMNEEDFSILSKRAKDYAIDYGCDMSHADRTRKLFEYAPERSGD